MCVSSFTWTGDFNAATVIVVYGDVVTPLQAKQSRTVERKKDAASDLAQSRRLWLVGWFFYLTWCACLLGCLNPPRACLGHTHTYIYLLHVVNHCVIIYETMVFDNLRGELFAILGKDAAIIVGAASTIVVVSLAVLARRLYASRIRPLVVERRPDRVLRWSPSSSSDTADASVVGDGFGGVVSRSVSAVDRGWAREHGLVLSLIHI